MTHERIFVANWDSTITSTMINNVALPVVAGPGSDQRELRAGPSVSI